MQEVSDFFLQKIVFSLYFLIIRSVEHAFVGRTEV